MIERFLGGVPLPGVDVEKMGQQVLGRRAEIFRPAGVAQLELGFDKFVVRDAGGVIIKRKTTAQ
jgi:hypothetical protein